MSRKHPLHLADMHGFGRLAIDATLAVTDLVEAVHYSIVRTPASDGAKPSASVAGIAGLVYSSIRGTARLLGGGADALLAPLAGAPPSAPERDAIRAALNGVLGDHLVASGNPLAIPMQLRQNGQALNLDAPIPLAALSQTSGHILLLVHGLCLSDRHWLRNGHDHGARLAAELGATPVYLFYNSGLHISTNGRALADLLEALLRRWPVPVEDVVVVGHSMGGLVARSACHYAEAAGHTWPQQLRAMVFLGSPHHGAPLERHGHMLMGLLGASPYTEAFARLGRVRSAGITDLRYGSLLDTEWIERDRFAHMWHQRYPVPLPAAVPCYAIGATLGKTVDEPHGRLLGDGLVPLRSALGLHSDAHLDLALPESRRWVGYAMGHLDLLDRPEVYDQLLRWLGSRTPPAERDAV